MPCITLALEKQPLPLRVDSDGVEGVGGTRVPLDTFGFLGPIIIAEYVQSADVSATTVTSEGTMVSRTTESLGIALIVLFLVAGNAFAFDCSSGPCDVARDVCFASLDLEPISCGIYYGCCYNKVGGVSGPPGAANAPGEVHNPLGVQEPPDIHDPLNGSGPKTITTKLAVGATAAGTLSVEVAADPQGRVAYNWWILGQGAVGWHPLAGVQTNAAPTAALVAKKYLFVVARGQDGTLSLNQGDVGGTFVGWQPMNFQSDFAPAAASSGNMTAVVAVKQNKLFYTWWDLGKGAEPWVELDGNGQTNAAPAAALIGNYLFVVAKGLDGTLYLNQGALGKGFIGWQRMGFQTNLSPGATSAGNTTVIVATDPQGHIFYNWWALGEGGHGWREIEGNGKTDAAPAAALVKDYLFVIAKGIDGNVRVNQGNLGKPFIGWQ